MDCEQTKQTLTELAERLDADPSVQWHRDHDKLHDLYEETRPLVTEDEPPAQ